MLHIYILGVSHKNVILGAHKLSATNSNSLFSCLLVKGKEKNKLKFFRNSNVCSNSVQIFELLNTALDNEYSVEKYFLKKNYFDAPRMVSISVSLTLIKSFLLQRSVPDSV